MRSLSFEHIVEIFQHNISLGVVDDEDEVTNEVEDSQRPTKRF